ncbi:MAG: hypothetical protein WDZ52_09025 [Pseudohongiellaceae bacterium]
MNEQKRQAFLRAMDIQPYYPRRVLVGAKASPIYEFPEPQLSAAEHEAVPKTDTTSAKSVTSSAKLDAIDALRADAKAATRQATVTPIGQSRGQSRDTSPSKQEEIADQAAENSLSFTLRYYRINESLAVLNEVPTEGSAQLNKDSLRLMQAILSALGQTEVELNRQPEEFSWPLQAGYSAKHTPEIEAAKAVSGFLQMRQETDGFSNLLVFAGQLEAVLLQNDKDLLERDFMSSKGYFITVTHSLASMLAITTLKRDVWHHLQALRKRLNRTS